MSVEAPDRERTAELRAKAMPRRSVGSVVRRGLVWIMPLATVIALVVLWELLIRIFSTPGWLVPSPSDIGSALRETQESFRTHFRVTLTETLLGYGASIALGIPVAITIVYSKFLERTIYPILVAMQSVPKIAVAPLLVLWMGFGIAPKIVLIMLLATFPIVISTATGLKSAPVEFVEVVQSLAATPLQIFRKVRFPAALPHIFVGLKVAVSLAVIGAVIGEFVGSNRGLGFVIIISQGNVRTDLAFASMLLLSLMSIGLFYALVALEKFIVPWGDVEGEK